MGLRRFHQITASTQREAVEWARAGAPPGSRVVAAAQEMGVGRLDHTWASPPGGLYLSAIVDDVHGPVALAPLAMAVGVRRALAELYGVTPSIRWPNDLLVPGETGTARKLGGLLVDRVESAPETHRLVLGVGLNVHAPRSAFPVVLRDSVVGLSELTTRAVNLETLEGEIARAVVESVVRLDRGGGPRWVVKELEGALFGTGAPALLDGAPVGVVRGIAEDGALETESDGAVLRHHSGTLTIVEEAA